jgi:P27 family predicted phage terminase small subunit
MNPNKPKEIKKLEGTYRKDRDTDGIKFPKLSELPKPPKELTKIAVGYFVNICLTLLEYGMLTGADVFLIKQLAQSFEINDEAYKNIKNGDAVQTTKNGFTTISAWYSIYDKSSKQIRELCNQFGFSPSARERIKNIKIEEIENAFDKLLKQK